VTDLASLNFDTMTSAEFEQYLPELFETSGGKVSNDPRLSKFLSANPDCAALVRDLETIADTARSLLEPNHEPSDEVWDHIASELRKDHPDAD
jgi:hypothetical protein